MSLSETLYGIFFEPVATLRYVAEQKLYGRALLILAAVMIWSMIFEQALSTGAYPMLDKISGQALWMIRAVGLLLSVAVLFLLSGFLSLISEIFYHQANAGGILVAFCYASVPGILGPPLQYAALLAGLEWLGVLLAGLAVLWVIILQVLGLREALQITTARSVLLFFVPLFILLALIIALAVIVAMTIPI